jgi:hypothetical protein
MQQISTFENCRNFLSQQGFSLIGRNPGERMCFIFRNDYLVSNVNTVS